MQNTLLITLDFWPNTGGVANYYYNLVKNLPKDNVFVLTDAKKEKSNLKIYNKPLLYKLIWPKWLKAFKETIKLIKKQNIKMLWVGNILPIGTIAYIINKLYKIPYFVSLHGFDIISAQKNSRKKYLAKKILNKAKFITVNSYCTKNLLNNIVDNKDKIKVIYPGINIDFIKINPEINKKIKEKYNLQNLPAGQVGKKIILTVGRLIKRKNHKLVINAVKQLKEKIPNLIYLIIGDGPELNNLKKLTDDNVIFLTNIDNNELPYFYNLSDIFVMISKYSKKDIEGFGIVYLEAGLFKKPVIACDQGGPKEAVINNETGILVEQNNVDMLKNNIIKLLENKELADRLGNNAFQRIKNNFLWQNIAQELIKYINEHR